MLVFIGSVDSALQSVVMTVVTAKLVSELHISLAWTRRAVKQVVAGQAVTVDTRYQQNLRRYLDPHGQQRQRKAQADLRKASGWRSGTQGHADGIQSATS